MHFEKCYHHDHAGGAGDYGGQLASCFNMILFRLTICKDKYRPSDLACKIAHAHHNSRKGEVRRAKYSTPHVVRPKKKYCLFPFSDSGSPYQNICDSNLFY